MIVQALLLLAAARSNFDLASDRAVLTDGVRELTAGSGVVGAIYARGEAATPLIVGNQNGIPTPVFVATHLGSGRALAGGHESFFGRGNLGSADNARFTANSMSWLSGQRQGRRIGTIGLDEIGAALPNDRVIPETRETLAADLPSLDVVCLREDALDGAVAVQDAVRNFVVSGHGLLVAGPAWGWRQLHPGRNLRRDHTGNQILFEAGIGFADGTVAGPFSPTGADSPALNATSALALISRTGPSSAERQTATATVQRGLELDDTLLAAQLRDMADAEAHGNLLPTASEPIARLALIEEFRRSRDIPPARVRPDPRASLFPGSIPTSALRVARTVAVDASIPDWHSTGLYAAPGETVTIETPEFALHGGLRVRIGAHTDTLWHKEKWLRFPEISREWPIEQATLQVANPFGGLVYIVVPLRSRLGPVTVRIGGAVEAPRFVRGQTSAADWRESIRSRPAPWGELEGKHVILTLPSDVLRTVDEPDALMSYWDEVGVACCEFFAVPLRPRPERYCTDIDISAGWMHSGYPIMAYDQVASTFVDLETLRGRKMSAALDSVWGFYHEMGHNFQRSAWTFEGTGEVTNNLFSMYGSERFTASSPDRYITQAGMANDVQRSRLIAYLHAPSFEKWQSDAFLALTMYLELRRAFGWDAFTRVFGEYEQLSPDAQPTTELEKRDQWMIRMSRAVGKNLGPFFQAWHVPTSDQARSSIADLPSWMPPDWPDSVR